MTAIDHIAEEAAEQIPLINMAAEPLPEFAPPRAEVFLVAAFHRQMGFWKIHRNSGNEEYLSYEQATAAAHKLAGCWTNLRVLRVTLE